ncbi:TBC1 domain family member 30-like isoform X2 [Polyodon spathula]|uniref:TBC1 domain family member 30-like isoform X2 n=1 Tax=Polyodon spathula TaxID=7913 RepID=UPI001B7EC4AB|nr:TBC1 domain family member 30-like isoform X2 [Polyodon spathula]
MASHGHLSQNELLDVDISCDDNCLNGENDVFASYDGFPAFQQWVPAAAPPTEFGQSEGGAVLFGQSAPSTRHLSQNHDSEDIVRLSSDSDDPCDARHGGAGNKHAPRSSIVDYLLIELYDTYTCNSRKSVDSVDSSTEASGSDAFLGRSNTESNFLQELQEKQTKRHQVQYLAQKDTDELKRIVQEVNYRIAVQSAKLVRQVKRKDRLANKVQKNNDIITACLQAVSQKRRVDTRLKFTIEPSLGKNGFQQWYDALKAVARLPTGIPKEWRKRVWLTLADQYLHTISIDWDKTMRFAFNDHSNPDDDTMGIQIVKDLHRTGCSSYCGQEAEQDRVGLKRVLLAYARWNKAVGYCQGFNVLAALILEVVEGNEGEALKVMIYLIDKVLPDSYFANNLRALSVDMAVFRDLLRIKLPELSQHLDHLQRAANRENGGSYEPPLTNVFTMQWFLTMFATCLPNHTVLQIWDSVFFEGSEVLLRVALAIWAKLGERIENCQSADEFYSMMGCLTQDMLEHNLIDSSDLLQMVYSMAVFPFPHLAELREKYTYNITPFPAPGKLGKSRDSDEEIDIDDEDSLVNAVGCLGPFSGLLAPELQRYHKHLTDHKEVQSLRFSNIAELSPGAIDSSRSEYQASFNSMMMERMTTDISALKRQYSRIKRRQQQQANLIYIKADQGPATSLLPSQIHHSPAMNHLLLGKKLKQTQRGSLNNIVHIPGAKLAPLPHEDMKTKLNSPWRTHVRVHRKNLARARGQLSYGDTIGLIEEPGEHSPKPGGDLTKGGSEKWGDEKELAGVIEEEEHLEQQQDDDEEEEEEKERPVEKADGQSPVPAYRDASITEVQHQLEALELSSTATDPEPPDPELPRCQRKASDSSGSESGGSSILKTQPFCPFPSVKPPRKSAAARNLGLYGPTSRTPTVHFPHMSKNVNRISNGGSGTKKR